MRDHRAWEIETAKADSAFREKYISDHVYQCSREEIEQHNAELLQNKLTVLQTHLTDRKRTYSEQVSYGTPTKYHENDPIIAITTVGPKRIEVDVQRTEGFGEVNRFVVLFRKDAWRIDSLKRRMSPNGTWRAGIF
ncbi:MAG: NTF2 fold immunity protein [Planctomycetota bacterium]